MPKRASVSRTSVSTVPRSSPTIDDAVAHAFERQDAEEIVRSFADIGALAGIAAVGNPVEAEESHDVIHAQGAAVAGVARMDSAKRR